MIPLAEPNLEGNEEAYLRECVRSTFVSSVGPFVRKFESMVAEATVASGCVATSSGTTALHAALASVGVGADDIVIVPSLTFIATMSAIRWVGASPWLFDVDRASWTIDAGLLERVLAEETEVRNGATVNRATGQRVAAILPVYTLGTPADMDPLRALADKYGLLIIADAAAALGARYRGRSLAKMGADLSMVSFNGNKTVTAGGGGAIVGINEPYLNRARHLTTTARIGDEYLHDEIGFNYRMTNLQAAVGCAQMERVDRYVARKRAIRRAYNDALGDLADVTLFPEPAWAESACWFSGIVLEGRSDEAMKNIVGRLRDAGIDARSFWRPMHLQPPLRNSLRTEQPVSEMLWFRILTLPCSTHLGQDEMERVIESVRKVAAHV